MHGSIWHLLFNMYFQLRMGFALEKEWGTGVFAGVYMISGIGGNLFTASVAPCISALGASTAGFGMIGMQLAEITTSWGSLPNKDEVLYNIVFYFFISIMFALYPNSNIDWRGHFGGFVVGYCVTLWLRRSEMDRTSVWRMTLWAIATTVALALFLLGPIYLALGKIVC
eukprot:Trichotokara_eunicae@DN1954_c0_g1_i1.p1